MKNLKKIINKKNKNKIIFTAGPASLLEENISALNPCFGRGDKEYAEKEKFVLKKILDISGQTKIVRMQGSASLALEIIASNFLFGKVLIVRTGYYSDRIYYLTNSAKKIFGNIKKIDTVPWNNLYNVSQKYDWIFACSTETSCGLKLPIEELYKIKLKTKAKLMLDATGSIGLENNHDLADVMAFSSCKGLFGLTGASFICYKKNPENEVNSFYLNIDNHLKKKMTGPYHAIYSLFNVLKNHSKYKSSVQINKKLFLKKMKNQLTVPNKFQPLLCTHVKCVVKTKNKKVILYEPRNNIGGSVVCHIGEVHLGKKAKGKILDNLYS